MKPPRRSRARALDAKRRRDWRTRSSAVSRSGSETGPRSSSETSAGRKKRNVTDAMRAAALSLGRVIVPFARLTDTTRIDDANRSASHGESSAVPASADAERRPEWVPGAGGARSVGSTPSASTASALVAEAASRAKRAVAGALGETLAERKARVFDLGLPASPTKTRGAEFFNRGGAGG